MEYSKGTIGRVFMVRVDHGEDLLSELEGLAVTENIQSAVFMLLGAVGSAELVVGPKKNSIPSEPIWASCDEPYEVMGIGNIFLDQGHPKIHLHIGAGRGEDVKIGCMRGDSETFMVFEICIMEIDGIQALRAFESERGFSPINFCP